MKTFSIASTYGWLLWTIACSPVAAKTEAVMPTLVPGSAKVLANVTDPAVSRDSCGSRRLGSRVLWVCRDTSGFNINGTTYGGLVPNSASWSDINSDNTPVIVHNAPPGSGSNGSNAVLQLYGGSYHAFSNRPFYPLAANEDPPAGFNTSAHTRFAVWPGQPPMMANSSGTTVSAYTWINQNEIYTNEVDGAADGKHVTANQPTSLYRVDFNTDAPASSDVPLTSTLVNEAFWPHDTWGYGSFLSFVNGTTAYLFANNEERTETALAKVPIDSVEDMGSYQYYVDGAWSKKRPGLDDSAAYIPNLGGGLRQGTVYWSTPFQCFIYVGQDANQTKGASKTCGRPTNDQAGLGCLEFFISTAPNPEGPWVTPYSFYSVPKGNGTLGAYSVQAHPEYVPHPETNKAIYITYTQRWSKDIPEAGNVHPLIYLELE